MHHQANILLLLLTLQWSSAWDPDAGIVTSFTKLPGVAVQTTSGLGGNLILDSDDATHWTSSHCLPTAFYQRPDTNILLNACSYGRCALSSSVSNIGKATDGSVYSVGNIHAQTDSHGITEAKFVLQLSRSQIVTLLSINGIFKAPSSVSVIDDSSVQHDISVLSPANNYHNVQFRNITAIVSRIEIRSKEDFSLKEIAGIDENGCIESVTVDLGREQTIGTVRTRHWAGSGNAFAVNMKFAADNMRNLHTVANLDPNALSPVISRFDPPETARYIRIEYHLNLRMYVKVYAWEIDAWDEHGEWGPPFAAKPQTNTVRSILGVNGIWGWGHNKYSDLLKAGEGPSLYAPLASHARNYHNLNWDVTDPDLSPNYDQMAAGYGTQAKKWLDWDKEYSAWNKSGMSIDASIQFTNKTFPEQTWTHPEQAAFNYGLEFATHFGPEYGNGLVTAMEVGNEPWDYNAPFYATILKNMAAGARSVDSKITILPAAFQADNKHDTGNYIGTRVLQDAAQNINVINSHHYSFVTNDAGVRIATYPEHRDSSFNGLRNIIRWRNTNTPNKPIWVTEWGWDAPHGSENCTFSECVSERESALYAVRGLMVLVRYGVEKATWFFYANADYCHTLFCRSGLTGSKKIQFAKTFTYHAFEKLLAVLGDKYFLGLLQEWLDGYVYLFGRHVANQHQSLKDLASHLVAWKPIAACDKSTSFVTLEVPSGKSVGKVWTFTGDERGIEDQSRPISLNGNAITVTVSSQPVIIELVESSSGLVG